jgi:hypothetical protein
MIVIDPVVVDIHSRAVSSFTDCLVGEVGKGFSSLLFNPSSTIRFDKTYQTKSFLQLFLIMILSQAIFQPGGVR